MDNRNLAAEWFWQALKSDIFCQEAFDCLVNHHMLTAQEGIVAVHQKLPVFAKLLLGNIIFNLKA